MGCKSDGTQVDILDATHQTIGSIAEFTADRWFGSLKWMNSHLNMLTTLALKKNQNELLFQLFGHDLKKENTEYSQMTTFNFVFGLQRMLSRLPVPVFKCKKKIFKIWKLHKPNLQ